MNSEIFITKLKRAHEALSHSDTSTPNPSIKTLSASFGTKWPYKRTMSAPATMLTRQDTKQGNNFILNPCNSYKRNEINCCTAMLLYSLKMIIIIIIEFVKYLMEKN